MGEYVSISIDNLDVLTYKNHLVELENLLKDATNTNPENRPSMEEFCDTYGYTVVIAVSK